MIPKQPFGETGHDSSRIIFGAAALFAVDQDAADGILAELLEAGINHIDVAASYGHAELRPRRLASVATRARGIRSARPWSVCRSIRST
jgi:aryl-alcohol dehydrogenase-like predicted oxidoreductase